MIKVVSLTAVGENKQVGESILVAGGDTGNSGKLFHVQQCINSGKAMYMRKILNIWFLTICKCTHG